MLLCDRCWIAKNKIQISPESSQRQRLKSAPRCFLKFGGKKVVLWKLTPPQNKQIITRNSTLHSVNPGTCTPLCDACRPLMLCSGAVASLQREPLQHASHHHVCTVRVVMLYDVVLLVTPCARSSRALNLRHGAAPARSSRPILASIASTCASLLLCRPSSNQTIPELGI